VKNTEKRDQQIKQWIKEAAEKLKEYMNEELTIEEKTDPQDLVTNVDKSIEQFLVDKIRTHYPDEEIVSEEGFGDTLTNLDGIVWFLDPIDGTTNFITQRENFAIMIAVYEDGVGQMGYVYDVMKDCLYYGIKDKGAYRNGEKLPSAKDRPLEKGVFASSTHLMTKDEYKNVRDIANTTLGVRMLGSAGLEICQVASQKAVVYMASILSPWDIAPGKVIAEEVGLVSTSFEGETLDLMKNNRAIFATPEAHRQIMDKLKQQDN